MTSNTSAQAHRILVAEDETLIRMDLVEMLGEAGYDVVAEASNGEEAVKLAKEVKPDLAILDVKMPILDGISAAEEIISIAPVLMLTAFSQKDLVERARDAGAMAYVVKPFTINDLVPASRTFRDSPSQITGKLSAQARYFLVRDASLTLAFTPPCPRGHDHE